MPHVLKMKDGKLLTPFGIRDLLDAVEDYAGEELRREKAVVKVQFTDSSRMTELHVLAGQKRAGAPAAEYSPRNP